jgi:hypothetical protein
MVRSFQCTRVHVLSGTRRSLLSRKGERGSRRQPANHRRPKDR